VLLLLLLVLPSDYRWNWGDDPLGGDFFWICFDGSYFQGVKVMPGYGLRGDLKDSLSPEFWVYCKIQYMKPISVKLIYHES
jgi:hypothetical protein